MSTLLPQSPLRFHTAGGEPEFKRRKFDEREDREGEEILNGPRAPRLDAFITVPARAGKCRFISQATIEESTK